MFPRCPQRMVREIELSHRVDVLTRFHSGEVCVASRDSMRTHLTLL